MAGGVYCAECKVESDPGSLFCTNCGRPLRRFAGPRGVEWGQPGTFAPPRRRRWPWIVGATVGALVVIVILALVVAFHAITHTRMVAVGTKVDTGNWGLVVRSIENPDSHVTDSAFPAFAPQPAAGDHFVGADVAVTNNTGTVQNTIVGASFELRDPIGHQYAPSHFGGSFGVGGTVPIGGLDPGATVAGAVVFEVPNTATNLTLYFLPDWPFPTRRVGLAVPGVT